MPDEAELDEVPHCDCGVAGSNPVIRPKLFN